MWFCRIANVIHDSLEWKPWPFLPPASRVQEGVRMEGGKSVGGLNLLWFKTGSVPKNRHWANHWNGVFHIVFDVKFWWNFPSHTQTLENVGRKISPKIHAKFHDTFGREKRRKNSLPHFCRVAALTNGVGRGGGSSSFYPDSMYPVKIRLKSGWSPVKIRSKSGQNPLTLKSCVFRGTRRPRQGREGKIRLNPSDPICVQPRLPSADKSGSTVGFVDIPKWVRKGGQ